MNDFETALAGSCPAPASLCLLVWNFLASHSLILCNFLHMAIQLHSTVPLFWFQSSFILFHGHIYVIRRWQMFRYYLYTRWRYAAFIPALLCHVTSVNLCCYFSHIHLPHFVCCSYTAVLPHCTHTHVAIDQMYRKPFVGVRTRSYFGFPFDCIRSLQAFLHVEISDFVSGQPFTNPKFLEFTMTV